jgi:hypothetical protein
VQQLGAVFGRGAQSVGWTHSPIQATTCTTAGAVSHTPNPCTETQRIIERKKELNIL